jgi:hypothetical protein
MALCTSRKISQMSIVCFFGCGMGRKYNCVAALDGAERIDTVVASDWARYTAHNTTGFASFIWPLLHQLDDTAASGMFHIAVGSAKFLCILFAAS